jgi:hypothetical protein
MENTRGLFLERMANHNPEDKAAGTDLSKTLDPDDWNKSPNAGRHLRLLMHPSRSAGMASDAGRGETEPYAAVAGRRPRSGIRLPTVGKTSQF